MAEARHTVSPGTKCGRSREGHVPGLSLVGSHMVSMEMRGAGLEYSTRKRKLGKGDMDRITDVSDVSVGPLRDSKYIQCYKVSYKQVRPVL